MSAMGDIERSGWLGYLTGLPKARHIIPMMDARALRALMVLNAHD